MPHIYKTLASSSVQMYALGQESQSWVGKILVHTGVQTPILSALLLNPSSHLVTSHT